MIQWKTGSRAYYGDYDYDLPNSKKSLVISDYTKKGGKVDLELYDQFEIPKRLGSFKTIAEAKAAAERVIKVIKP